jgi:hypothetical protein
MTLSPIKVYFGFGRNSVRHTRLSEEEVPLQLAIELGATKQRSTPPSRQRKIYVTARTVERP